MPYIGNFYLNKWQYTGFDCICVVYNFEAPASGVLSQSSALYTLFDKVIYENDQIWQLCEIQQVKRYMIYEET